MDAFLAFDPGVALSFSWAWYRQTAFSTPQEVHAFQLGVYGGVLLLGLRAREYRHTATALTVALYAFAMGFPDVYAVCRRSATACGSLPIQLKPWYFLTGLLAVGVVGPRFVGRGRRILGRGRRWLRGRGAASGRSSDLRATTDGGRRPPRDGQSTDLPEDRREDPVRRAH